MAKDEEELKLKKVGYVLYVRLISEGYNVCDDKQSQILDEQFFL